MTRVNRMYMLLPIVLLLTVNSFDITLDEWQIECPFSNFCTTESLEKINETADLTLQPCCQRCSCDKDCFVFDNCCPDVRTGPPVDLQKANCTQLKITNELAGIGFADEYRVINFCPRGYDVIDQRLVDQCEERYVNDLNDVVAVSDIKNRIYKNKYCALCQGVRDFVSWTLKLVACRESFYKTTVSASQVTQAILSQCALHSVPPNDGGQYETMLCGRSLISSCSSTTNGSDSDVDDIMEWCLNGPYLPFKHYGFYNQTLMYKNVFCYLCEYGGVERHMCSRSEGEITKGQHSSFSILLRLQLGTTNQPQVTSETPYQCAETAIYDHVKGNCRRVFCPPYHAVFYGRCLGLGELTHYGTKLRIQSTPNDSILFATDLNMFEQDASRAYARNVIHEYGLEHCDIASFSLIAIVDKKTDTIAVMETQMSISFNDRCDATFISHKVRTRLSERHDISIVINTTKVNLSGQITFYDQSLAMLHTSALYDSWSLIYIQGKFNFRSTMTNDFFLCPHFIVDIQQYNYITTDVIRDGNERNLTEISELTRLENGFYSLTNDSIAVCIDTYFELYAKSRGLTTMVAGSLFHGFFLTLSTFLIYALIN